jgi:hypothetical protein
MEDREAIASGGVEPVHGRTMKEQKAWFLQKAAVHAKKVMAAQKASTVEAVADSAATPPQLTVASSDQQTELQASATASAVDAPAESGDSTQPSTSPQPLSDELQQLSLLESVRRAGGDVAALRTLAVEERRSELRDALKSLGFTGLQTRSKLEKELRAHLARE